MISKIRKNYKLGVAFILGILVSGIGVYAATSIESKNVSYDNSNSGMEATTLKGAIDELYERSTKKTCKVVEGSKTTVGSTVNCEGENFYISTVGETTTLIAQYGLNSSHRQSTTPTKVNYSDATKYIENYAKNTLSGIKGNISFYGHTTQEEVIKLSTTTITQWAPTIYYVGEKLSIGSNNMSYWINSSEVFQYIPGPNAYNRYPITDNTSTSVNNGSMGIYSFYARPMMKIHTSIIVDL